MAQKETILRLHLMEFKGADDRPGELGRDTSSLIYILQAIIICQGPECPSLANQEGGHLLSPPNQAVGRCEDPREVG